MKIMPEHSYNTSCRKSVSFGSTDRYYKTEAGKEIGNNTWLFREDISWHNLAQLEISHFQHKDKVNIIQFAASDGSEGYTQIMSLLENAKRKEVNKFFPIQAFDINEFIINRAKSGKICLGEKDIQHLRTNSINIPTYFERMPFTFNLSDRELETLRNHPYKIIGTRNEFKVSDILTSRISFKQGDMFEILPKIKDDSNTIILCRNILGYFFEEPNIINNFVETISKVLKKGSLFVIGKLDTELLKIEKLLKDNSFIKISKTVFLKVK